MSHRPSQPPKPPSDERTDTLLQELADAAPLLAASLGLSKAQYNEVVKVMLAVVRRVGCPVHVHALEVIHDAFVKAITKPTSQRPSSGEWKRFVGWMCALTEQAALTNRKSTQRRLLSQGHSQDDIDKLLSTPGFAEVMDARLDLRNVLPVLSPADVELLRAIYEEGKTISEFAVEKKLSRSTADSRHQRVLERLRAALKVVIAAMVWLFPKNVRAQGLWLAHRVSQLVPHTMQTVAAMTVAVACGVLVPASSTATVEHRKVPEATLAAVPRPTFAAAMALSEPPVAMEVEPVKPIAIDDPEMQWCDGEMKATTIARSLQATMLPVALLVTPTATQVACAGAEHHAAPPPEPEEEEWEGGPDPYESMCESAHRLGGECPSKVDWCAQMGKRPATKGCK